MIDSDTNKQGKWIHDIPIRPPSYLEHADISVFICSTYKKEIYNDIKKIPPYINNSINIFRITEMFQIYIYPIIIHISERLG